MPLAVANQYAKALLEIAAGPASKLEPFSALRQLELFRNALEVSPELREILVTPAVSRETKHRALTRVAALLGLHPTVVNFLSVLKDHRRIGLLGEICQMFRAQLDERLGVVRAQVRSARETSPAQREALEARLRTFTGKQVECEYTVAPEIIGGVTVTIGSTIYDGSVEGRLQGLCRRLSGEA
jgi:F-type H+-transporting ATPase subunit delta